MVRRLGCLFAKDLCQCPGDPVPYVGNRTDFRYDRVKLAERIVGEQLTNEELSQRVIDRFMSDVEADLASTPTGADA